MFQNELLTNVVKITKIQDHTAAGTTTITSDAVDMQGYEGCVFRTSFGTAAADNSVKVQQSDDDGVLDAYSDLEGTSLVTGASPSNEDVIVDVKRPTKRYLKFIAIRTTSSTLESMWADRYGARNIPIDNNVSGTLAVEQHHAPAEGTA